MVKVSLNPHRIYLAAIVIVAVMLIFRSHDHSAWTPNLVQIAGVADFLVIGSLILAYKFTDRLLLNSPVAAKLNKYVHLLLAVALIVTVCLSQALFLKTGELLNFDMLAFFANRFDDLKEVGAGAFDNELVVLLGICTALLMLACLKLPSRLSSGLQYFALLLPVGLVCANPVIFPDKLDGKISLPDSVQDKRLYRGQYGSISSFQKSWNNSGVTDWRRGILTGMPVSSLGVSTLQALAKDAPMEWAYERPKVVANSLEAGRKYPNVLFVVLESFRFDAVGAYQNHESRSKSNTPFMDGLAKSGWRVESAYTTIPHTSKALVGIYCGVFPRMETAISEAIPGNLPLNCLPHLLKESGYRSAHFQMAVGSFENRVPFLANVGFDDSFTQESLLTSGSEWAKLGYLGADDRAMIDPAVNWMQAQKKTGKPFFASLLTITTHHPYVTPSRIEAIHEPQQAKRAYDDAVRYTDQWLRELYGKMQKAGLLNDTLVVITGDHGEAFSEHGLIGHNAAGYEEGIRVPLILSGPMLGEARVIRGLRQHIDIMPTVLDLAGVGYTGSLPGKSLGEDPLGHAGVVTACFYSNYCLAYLSEQGDKVIYFYGKRKPEMYDLRHDTAEKNNLYGEDAHAAFFEKLGRAAKLKASHEAVYRPSGSSPSLQRLATE